MDPQVRPRLVAQVSVPAWIAWQAAPMSLAGTVTNDWEPHRPRLASGGRTARKLLRSATYPLALCDMSTLYLRNVPDEVGEGLESLAAREGMSVSAFAVRELTRVARRANNPRLLGDLPDLRIEPAAVLDDIDAGRAVR